jgi:hypothetical protein
MDAAVTEAALPERYERHIESKSAAEQAHVRVIMVPREKEARRAAISGSSRGRA